MDSTTYFNLNKITKGTTDWDAPLRETFDQIDSALNTINKKYVNVKDYGAKGDGITDDTTAINNAYNVVKNVGGEVYFPAGIYIYNGSLILLKSTSLRGCGIAQSGKGTYIKINAGSSPAIQITDETVKISDMLIQNNGGTGIGIWAIRQLIMSNVLVDGFVKTNLLLEQDASAYGAYESLFTNCIFTNSKDHGVVVGNGANDITFINCQFKWNGFSDIGGTGTNLNKDGLYVDIDYNPNSVPSALPQSLHIIGGDASYNGGYGWNFVTMINSYIATGYSEGNQAINSGDTQHPYQVHIGRNVRYSDIKIGACAYDIVGIFLDNTYSPYNRTNTIWYGGKFLGGGSSDKHNYMFLNFPNIILADDATETTAATKIAWLQPDLTNGLYNGGYSLNVFDSNNTNATFTINVTGTPILKVGKHVSIEGHTIVYGSSVPTTGTWTVGDICYNTTPTPAGGAAPYVGWVYTLSGWKTFGAISS